MSLINDALKRASQARPPEPPEGAATSLMRPVTVAGPRPFWPIWLLPPAVLLIVSVSFWFLWRGWQLSRQSPPPTTNAVVLAREPAPLPATAVPPTPLTEPAPAADAPAIPALVVVPATPAAASASAPAAPIAAPTNVEATALATPPPSAPREPPPRFKLQSIFYQPGKSAVVINSRLLSLGEEIDGARVLAISRDSATLGQAGETNVLTLR